MQRLVFASLFLCLIGADLQVKLTPHASYSKYLGDLKVYYRYMQDTIHLDFINVTRLGVV